MSDSGAAGGPKTGTGKRLKSPSALSTENNVGTQPQSAIASSTPKIQDQPRLVHEAKPVAQSNCGICDKPDDERMVQCDTCDVWHHFSCVDVSQDVNDRSWICLKCVNAKASSGRSKSKRKTTVSKRSFTALRKKAVRVSNAKGSRKMSSQVDRDNYVEDVHVRGDVVPPVSLDEKAAVPVVRRVDSIGSATSFRSAKVRLNIELKQIEAEETLMREEMHRKRDLVNKKFSILKEIADLESVGGSITDHQSIQHKVDGWLKHRTTFCSEERSRHSREQSVSGVSDEGVQPEDGCSEASHRGHGRSLEKQHTITSTGGRNEWPIPEQRHSLRSNGRLSKGEIAARQVVPRELPKFGGNPEEWPMFLSTYEDTTEMCGYTEAENMIRLRNCLKGDAYNAVRSFLLRPETVRNAINALKLRFGRPEFIIEQLKEKIISMPSIRPDGMDKLVDFALEVQNLCATIEIYGEQEHMCDASLLKELVKKLPPQIKLDWARYIRKLSTVKLAVFGRWIYGVAEDVNLVFEPHCRGGKQQEFRGARKERYVNAHSETHSQDRIQPVQRAHEHSSSGDVGGETKACPACKGDCKNLGKCKRFQELSYEARWATVRGFNFCRKCLRQHKGGCNPGPCGKDGCTFKHHVLLHKYLTAPAGSSSGIFNERSFTNQTEERRILTHESGTVPGSFRYLPVTLFGDGVQVECFAFLDDGSELTLIDQELAKELKISGDIRPLCLKWTGGTHRYESDSQSVNVGICGRGGRRSSLRDVRTVRGLQLPFQSLDMAHLGMKYKYLSGIPVDSYTNVRPRILIGLRHANFMLVRQSREGRIGEPIAVKTHLGWTVYGGWTKEHSPNSVSHTYHICTCSEQNAVDLSRMVKDYFSIDSLVVKHHHPQLSKNDERAMLLLESLTRFNGHRYETGLLWCSDKIRLPDNKAIAVRRLKCLEKRMEKDEELANFMNDKIAEYSSKNYIRKLSPDELKEKHERVWYLPIFPVHNTNKPGKIRIVWDAAAQAHGTSLNSALLTGPDQLASLVGILYQFREHLIGICADIREMFHQVGIISEDQHCQRFLWRDHAAQSEPSTYVMQVMTFGASCSPAAAQFVKNKNADRFVSEYPRAVNIIKKNHYVDDMVLSVETEQMAIELAEAVRFIHMQGGFEIRNWVSNSSLVLSQMNGGQSVEKDLNITAELASQKILGMWWDTRDDTFKYKICWTRFDEDLLKGRRCPTKREILRTLMTIYDPIGLIDHFLILLKMLLQDVWRADVEWDENIPENLFERWRDWLRLLPELERLRIPRCIRQFKPTQEYITDLHVFVDASESAMSAVVFLRFVVGKNVECALVAAKTRVAPLKYMSIPRLELQAAVLGCRLAATIVQNLTIKISKRTFWTDSRNVLCWLRSDHKRYSAFVGSRVSEILEITDLREWRWVPTRYNVADDGTRWSERPDLSSESRWYKGPEFLKLQEEAWPILPLKSLFTEEEIRSSVLFHGNTSEPVIDVNRFSNWRRLLAVTGYVLRFISNVRRRLGKKLSVIGPLLQEELRSAEEQLYRQAQRDVYSDEVSTLELRNRAPKQVAKTSPLYTLSPFVDDVCVMRMKGRTGVCSYLHSDAKNPVILPPAHPVTSLILVHYHEKYLHRNHEIVVNEIRQKYKIFRLRQLLAKTRRNCQWCKNRDIRPLPPEMADLPAARLSAYMRPFAHVGVDYFGPIEVCVGRRIEKRWGVLLTCLTTRAVHIEIAYSLTTSSCIMALQNFIARRGTPVCFYSDYSEVFTNCG